jgi:hypothetical protein
LNEEVKTALAQLRKVGNNLTFESEFVADFIELLDKLIDVIGVRMDGNTLELLVGDTKKGDPVDILNVVSKATLLNVTAAWHEETPFGRMIYFEYYIPPWNQFEV